MRNTARAWLGYLEHKSNALLGIYTANAGKGGYTIFSAIIQRNYRWRNFSGLPWCTTFVHAVCIETYGKEKARRLLGKPHPGSRVLLRRIKRGGRLRGKDYNPLPGDLIFLHNGDGLVSHCGIVDKVEGDTVVTIEGNTVDPTGHFQRTQGGAVAERRRKLTDDAIVGYGRIGDFI